MTPEIILSIMLAQPPWKGDAGETLAQRTALLRPVAAAIVEVSQGDRTRAARLVALGYAETRWARYVLEDRCSEGPVGARCDEGRARGPWQVWRWCKASDLVGQAQCALRALGGAELRCRRNYPNSPHAAAFAGYATGSLCAFRGVYARVSATHQIEGKLWLKQLK